MSGDTRGGLSRPWKVLIVSMIVYLVFLTWGFLRLSTYFLWLYFDCGQLEKQCHEGIKPLLNTAPGTTVFWWLIGVGIFLVILNIVVFSRATSEDQLQAPDSSRPTDSPKDE